MGLYDLLNDTGEATDVAGEHPDVMAKLLRHIAEARQDLGDGVIQVIPDKKDFFQSRRLFKMPGNGQRPAGAATSPARSWLAE
jgi:hypothetical protein